MKIKVGECFRFVDSDVVYMRTNSILDEHNGVIDVVTLSSGRLGFCPDSAPVLRLKMEGVEK